jgi:phosphatidate cytidylyltransferase
LCYVAVAGLVVSNWPAHVVSPDALGAGQSLGAGLPTPSWLWVLGTFTAVVLTTFLVEMATFREPGTSVPRMALTVWLAAYLGLLTSFFAQLRWLPRGAEAMALTIAVPKIGDIGAYAMGRLIGKHRMTPVLSPKKTWEGLAGGLAAAVLAAFVINRLTPALAGGDQAAVGFGLTVGVAGVLGDLAESLIKRDCRQKDASQNVPGFGGILDVVDSIVFAAPVAYCWLTA